MGLPPALAGQLTERESQVVLLTLQGYPVIEIARKLGLSRGTVKNYRLAIYRKLDITTERELFGEYMAAIRDQGLAGPLPDAT
jgi:DNA-binding CsgD family transcriptional regulator